jgi:hypothetical protein
VPKPESPELRADRKAALTFNVPLGYLSHPNEGPTPTWAIGNECRFFCPPGPRGEAWPVLACLARSIRRSRPCEASTSEPIRTRLSPLSPMEERNLRENLMTVPCDPVSGERSEGGRVRARAREREERKLRRFYVDPGLPSLFFPPLLHQSFLLPHLLLPSSLPPPLSSALGPPLCRR